MSLRLWVTLLVILEVSTVSRIGVDVNLTLGIILYNLSQSAVWNFLRLQIYDLQGSFTEIMLITSIPSLFGFLFSKFWGDLSDHIGSRKIPMLLGTTLSTLTIPFLMISSDITYLLAVYTIMSFASVISNPALNAAISETAPYEYRGKQIGTYMAFLSLGWTTGTILGGYIVELYGYHEMYLFSFAMGILGVIPLSMFKDTLINSSRRKLNFREIFRSSLEFEVGSSKVKFLVAAVFVHVFATSLFYNVYTLVFYEIVNKNAFFYGLVNGVAGISSIFAPRYYGSFIDKVGRKRTYIIASLIYVPYFLALSNIRDVLTVIVLWFIPIWPGVQISITALATDIAERDKVARSQGVVQAVSSIARILGPLLGGIAGDFVGARANINNLTVILDIVSFIPLISVYFASKL